MKKYWIIENGKPIGPFSQSELKVRRDFTADLPVWCAELPDWTTVGEFPELACLLEAPAEQEPEQPRVEEPAADQPRNGFFEPQPMMQPFILATPPDEINGVKRPKSYMAWNVVALLCCCLPAAVVGLIYSSRVNQKWMRGDVEGAIKASDYAQWAFIISFTLGLITWPLQFLFI